MTPLAFEVVHFHTTLNLARRTSLAPEGTTYDTALGLRNIMVMVKGTIDLIDEHDPTYKCYQWLHNGFSR